MIQLDLRPELEAQIAAQAQARGLALEQYIVEKLEASSGFGSPGQPAVNQAIKNIRVLREEQFAERDAAVDAMSRFAAQNGFINKGDDLKAMAHEGHKY